MKLFQLVRYAYEAVHCIRCRKTRDLDSCTLFWFLYNPKPRDLYSSERVLFRCYTVCIICCTVCIGSCTL